MLIQLLIHFGGTPNNRLLFGLTTSKVVPPIKLKKVLLILIAAQIIELNYVEGEMLVRLCKTKIPNCNHLALQDDYLWMHLFLKL